MFNIVVILLLWHFPAYFWRFYSQRLKAYKAKAAQNRNATATKENNTEGSQERTTKKQALRFLRNCCRCIFFFLQNFVLIIFIMRSCDDISKITQKSGRNSARGTAIVCKNFLSYIAIYPAPNYIYEVWFTLQRKYKNSLLNGTNFVFNSVKTRKLSMILLKLGARWLPDCIYFIYQ